ncbi:MAG: hypothetical protein RLY98_1481 [Bacteroidota bacterium]|jgi:hypothetical protein
MVKESDKFDPRLVWSNIRKINVTPESVFKESDFDVLMKRSYWEKKEKHNVINKVIVCDYLVLQCISEDKLRIVYKMYEAFCKSLVVVVNEEDSEVKLLNHFPKLDERGTRFNEDWYVVIQRSKQQNSSSPYLFSVPGPQAKNFVNFILFDELFRNFCWKHEITINRLDVKCICKRKKNFYTNLENHGQLKELLQKDPMHSESLQKNKTVKIYLEDSSHEYKKLSRYFVKLGTTTYIKDYKYLRRIYNYVGSSEVHFELQQSNSHSLGPYNNLYGNSTKGYEDFVELMKSTFLKEFARLSLVPHDLTKDFLENILKIDNVVYKSPNKFFNGLMKYLYQPELKENPTGPLLVNAGDNFVVNTKLTPIMTILYHFCHLKDLNNQVEFTRREVINLLGWEYNQRNCSIVEKSLDELWCSSYFIENSDNELKGRLITTMQTFKKGERRYKLTLNGEFFENSLSKGELNQTLLKSLYVKYKKELENLNIRQFPTVMFYQIYTFLSTTCYENGISFPYKVGNNYESEKSFYVLFGWMLNEFHCRRRFKTETIYSELKEACESKSLLKRKDEKE